MSAPTNDNVVARRRPLLSEAQPFRSAEAAWLWTMECIVARRGGSGEAFGIGANRPCEPDDVVKALDRLYRQRRLGLHHARIMRIWGEKGRAPLAYLTTEKADARIWSEAMRAMDTPLRARGIVA